ncbi:MAG TPA: hypothetical protein VKR60_15555 [Candidatus Sulfotelmatobacter sp.]|nr:hypothetical protein [Candidatus Sulfotelmatobacter sp.]
MFSSALRVAENTPTRLTVVDPPFYWVGFVFLFLGLILVLACFSAASQPNAPKAIRSVGIFFALLFLIPGLWVSTDRTTLIFSRDSGTLSVIQQRMLLYHHTQEVPLRDVMRVDVEAGRGTRRLVVLMSSGGGIGIGGHTTQVGQYEVAKTMNDFLKSH